MVTGVVDLDVFEGAGTGIAEDGGVHGDVTLGATLAPSSDDPQGLGAHAVH